MDMTVAELHAAVSHHLPAPPTQPASHFPLQEVTFDPLKTSAAKTAREMSVATGVRARSAKHVG